MKALRAVLVTLAIFAVVFIVASNAATVAAVGLFVVKGVAAAVVVASPVKLLPFLAALA